MENFIQHAVRGFCICSLLWNVVHTIDFEDFEERHKKAKEDFGTFDTSFDLLIMPLVIGLLFVVVVSVIFCCSRYCRWRHFSEMQQQQHHHHVPGPLAPVLGPSPVMSGAVGNYGTLASRIVPSAPAPYQPQPVGGAYPRSRPYTSVNDAPSEQPLAAAATPWPCAPPPPPYSSDDTKQLI